MAVTIMAIRLEWIDFRTASGYLRQALQFSLVVGVLSVVVLVFAFVFARSAWMNMVRCALALIIVAVPLAVARNSVPAGTALFAAQRGGPPPAGANAPGRAGPPPINDISTDTLNPPVYSAVIALRPEGSNSLEYGGERTAQTQATLYPDIHSIVTDQIPDAAFARAIAVANDFGWDIVAENPEAGTIEAVAATPFFGLKDDIIIRVTEKDGSSVVDIRSHSRIGRGDRGKNADRVRAFIDQF